ncbi:MAG: ATP-binding protein, partial [Thermodesulfobacteriota bacterium]
YKIVQADSLIPKDPSLQIALSYAKESFVDKFPYNRGFILMGPSGVGKTHLAIGTIAELTLKKGVRCMFKDFFFLLNDLKKAYSDGVAENDIINPLVETEVLVIDELGKGKSNEWELNILDQLISKRYNSSKKTLITTNYISKDHISKNQDTTQILENRVGERISSRLYEMCELYLLEGKDFRRESEN